MLRVVREIKAERSRVIWKSIGQLNSQSEGIKICFPFVRCLLLNLELQLLLYVH